MSSYFIKSFIVKALWNNRDIKIDFFKDVTIIIGPNASGKTTLINILQYTLTGNVEILSDYVFDQLIINLSSFSNNSTKKIRVRFEEDYLCYKISQREFKFPLIPKSKSVSKAQYSFFVKQKYQDELNALQNELSDLVPAVWLPVSRRLPINEEEDDDRRILKRSKKLESVDECLDHLARKLSLYRLSLDSEQSELYKTFQKHVFEMILYNKEHDQFKGFEITPPKEEDKLQLIKAFTDADIMDRDIKARINEHFKQATIVADKSKKGGVEFKEILILPLIGRTTKMVQFAKELDENMKDLFKPLNKYLEILNSFLDDKEINVDDNGELVIITKSKNVQELDKRQLSSGEKQIFILLTQALLWEKVPVVYVADEPELSLHVTWQAKLLKSLMQLAGKCQLIVATHSPDIAGAFENNIIDLARK